MRTNAKPQPCCWCGKLCAPGEGSLRFVDEEDEGLGFGPFGMTGWVVACLDREACNDRR